jgi:uncharacterized protein YcaQ
MTLDELRRFAVSRSLFAPTTLQRALDRLGFVQADPIRAPARAQDLTLRHRVKGYRAGDLDRRYAGLDIEEDVFINYGFVTPGLYDLMHPRAIATRWPPGRRKRADALLAFVRQRGEAHPRDVDRHFSHGRVTNYWGGSSSATTHLMDLMHYAGLLRVARRENGIRIYTARESGAAHEHTRSPAARVDGMIDVLVQKYGPVPAVSLGGLVGRLRYASPVLRRELKNALERARRRLSRSRVDGVEWYWTEGERPAVDARIADAVHLLTPFDPVVWDRRRFELLWGWAYRFEAYTPVAKRKLGYYALPLLWRNHVIGWANLPVVRGSLAIGLGYVAAGPPKEAAFNRELEAEVDRVREFLGLRARN